MKKTCKIRVILNTVLALFIFSFLAGCTTTESTNNDNSTLYGEGSFSEVNYGDGYIFVMYKNRIDQSDTKEKAKIIISGMYIDYKYCTGDDLMGVSIKFTNDKLYLYMLKRSIMTQYKNGAITADELVDKIIIKEITK